MLEFANKSKMASPYVFRKHFNIHAKDIYKEILKYNKDKTQKDFHEVNP